MYDSSGDLNGCHRAILQLKDQASDTRVQLGFRDYRHLSGQIRIFWGLLPVSRLFGYLPRTLIDHDRKQPWIQLR